MMIKVTIMVMMMTMINDDDGGDDNDDDESEETDSSNVGNESAWATVLLTIRMNLKPTTNDISMLDNHRTYPNPTHLYVLQQKNTSKQPSQSQPPNYPGTSDIK